MRSLSLPSVMTLTWPSEPVSIVCTCVLPVIILVASIPVKFAPDPTKLVAVIIPLDAPSFIVLPTKTSVLAVITPT